MKPTDRITDQEFMFDTADADYIRRIWDQLGKYVPGEMVTGITTNPSALSKVDCQSLSEMENIVTELGTLLTEIRGGLSGGYVHVQVPRSRMAEGYLLQWIDYASNLTDGTTGVAVKVPHFNHTLNTIGVWGSNIKVPINVTGISDWGTITKALHYDNVKYASLIPGRMEEAGIDANKTMAHLAGIQFGPYKRIIAGSMRKVEGLIDAILYGLVPTIGSHVWNQFLSSEYRWDGFSSPWELYAGMITYRTESSMQHAPDITDINRQLSKDFFTQMDELGAGLAREFDYKIDIPSGWTR